MSVLVFKDKQTAANAVATVLAAQLIEKPSCNIGLDYDPGLVPVFGALAGMSGSGMLDWSGLNIFQLCERVKTDAARPLREMLHRALLSGINYMPQNYYAPPSESTNWSDDCKLFEDRILQAGGLDMALVALKDDGCVLYNRGESELPPITHVEIFKEEKVVTAGIPTIMMAGKLVLLATGRDKAQAVRAMLQGPVTTAVPASYLQLHASVTFILDEDAASLL
ncbi:MAG: 6-phosphogluconolactonase [Clostridiales bacterium]|nr:6-phosphogluconolactonase [Clostridiales bacterium]